ncbi:MAG: 50S ribosomal protein L30e [Candidatus Lokiarchaeota archaeon]|nr:50S ribosomal protein L30e [Candidatus Lokiarchaeota archaeon]
MAKRGRTDADMKMKRRKRTSRKKEADINKLINVCVKTGKTVIGTQSVLNYINTDSFRVIILAQNCPANIQSQIEAMINAKHENRIPVYEYPNSSWELGTAAGKPHMIAVMGIINPGDSSILDVISQQK